jgi:hypothetical protein
MNVILIIIVVESVNIETRLRAGPASSSIPASAQAVSEVHPVPYPMDTGLPFPEIKRLGRETDTHPHLEHKFENEWSYASTA